MPRKARRAEFMRRTTAYDMLSVTAVTLLVIAALLYAQIEDVYDFTTLVVSVVVPVVFGTLVLAFRKDKTLLFAFLAFIWAVLDDRPVFFDSVLTWPEVTRFHPLLPRLAMNVVIHGLTLVFMYLALRETAKLGKSSFWKDPKVILLAGASFVAAYAQNIPLAQIQELVASSWYPFDLFEKSVAVLLFYLAVRETGRMSRGYESTDQTNVFLSRLCRHSCP